MNTPQISSHQLSIIIPLYNEEACIDFLIQELNHFFSASQNRPQVVFVDDGSTDSSVDRLIKGQHVNYDARIVKLSQNYGSHAALRAGIQESDGEWICFMYADLQDPLSVINKMLNKCLEGNDIVWAQRTQQNIPFMTKLFSNLYARLMRTYVIKIWPKNGFDVVMFNQKIKPFILTNIEAHSSIFLQIFKLGFKRDFVTYEKVERKLGKSKWTFANKIKLVIDSFVSFSYAPIRFVSVLGFFFAFFGFLWSLYLVYHRLFVGDLVPGWTSLGCILMLGFGLTNISLGILAEYLWRTLEVARNRPNYIIEKVYSLNGQNR